jgi:hypothetical protein
VLLKLIELLRKLFLPAQELTLPSEPSSFYGEERKRKKGGILRKLFSKTIKKLLKRLTQKVFEFVFKQSKVAHSFTNFTSSKPIVLNYQRLTLTANRATQITRSLKSLVT